MSTHTKKYLVTGESNGQVEAVLQKIKEVNDKNGPFNAAFIMGGAPTIEEDLSGLFNLVKSDYSSKFPIYFVSGPAAKGLLEDSLIEELSQRNIHFSRPFGVSKTPEGLRFAFISGSESRHKTPDSITIKESDLEYIEEQFVLSEEKNEEGLLDMLFTWSWPSGIISGSSTILQSDKIARLIHQLKPRYIFCPSYSDSFHFERPPYENIDSKSGDFLHATRFISLASCLNDNQKKWIYALSIEPAKFCNVLTLGKRPENCTPNPFEATSSSNGKDSSPAKAQNYFFQVPHDAVIGSKRRIQDSLVQNNQLKRPPTGYVCKKCHSTEHFYRDCPHQDSKYNVGEKSTYICHICHEPGHNIRDCPKKDEQQDRKSAQPSKVAPESCWFCLSNPAARKHLIVDIGDEVYTTLAKGPLTPEHMLIIPIEHVSASTKTLSTELQAEINQNIEKIRTLMSSLGKVPIFFRLHNNPTHHYHIQMIPIDAGKVAGFSEFLSGYASNCGFNFVEDDPSGDGSYFEFMFCDADEKAKKLSHVFQPDTFFPAQFGRQVLAEFLDVTERADWKTQTYSEEEEKNFVNNLKKHF